MRRRLGVLLAFLLAGTTILLASSTVVLAAPAADPMVFVARDVTASSACVLSQHTNKGSVYVSYSRHACPEGTIIQLFKVPQSEATARGERYIVLPHEITTSVQHQAQLRQQLETLIDDARNSARQSAGHGKIQPFDTISCGMNRTVEMAYSPGWDTQNIYIDDVNYGKPELICPDISINWSSIKAYQSHSAGYWLDDKYAGSTWGRGCQYIGTTGNLVNMGDQETAGYDFLQEVSSGSWCAWWDSWSSFDIGTLG